MHYSTDDYLNQSKHLKQNLPSIQSLFDLKNSISMENIIIANDQEPDSSTRSSTSSPNCTKVPNHAVVNLLNFDQQQQQQQTSNQFYTQHCQYASPEALIAALTASLTNQSNLYRPNYQHETTKLLDHNLDQTEPTQNGSDTPPMSSSSSSSMTSTPTSLSSKKRGLSDVINKLHKAASTHTSPSKSGDLDLSNEDDQENEHDELNESQINDESNEDDDGCKKENVRTSSQIAALITSCAPVEPSQQIEKTCDLKKNFNKSQLELCNLLDRANLSQYFSSFIEQGGDDINQLCEADEAELKEICDLVGMSAKPLHVKRLKKSIDEYKNKSLTEFSTLEVQNPQSDQNKKSPSPSNQVQQPANTSTHHSITKFLPNELQTQTQSHNSNPHQQQDNYSVAINLPTLTPTSSVLSSASSSLSSSSSSSSSSSTTSSSSSSFSISKIFTNSNTDHPAAVSTPSPLNNGLLQTATQSQSTLGLASFYPLYKFSNYMQASNLIQSTNNTTNNVESPFNNFYQTQTHLANESNNKYSNTIDQTTPTSLTEQKLSKVDETLDDEDCGEPEEDEDEENYDDYADTDEIDEEDEDNESVKSSLRKHSFTLKQKQQEEDNASLGVQLGQQQVGVSSIKIEQNEKMMKKNKVIELYTKGERCVRKLSQLTGVPLTTVYRVIGKLKGINYNIPRGNGAGRKTILDSQDREILVEILNKQPRISRKALGKELEKLTGKSIHNSTLNRELCRLRYQGQNFTSGTTPLLVETSKKQENDPCNSNEKSNNYMKHFSSKKNQSTVKNTKLDKKSTLAPTLTASSATPVLTHINLDHECTRLISSEAKRFCYQLTQYDIECKPISALGPILSKQIIEICQMSTNLSQTSAHNLQQVRSEKIKQVVAQLLKFSDQSQKSFYDSCLQEACVQICLLKPTLLTRQDDLVANAKKVLENCSIFDESSLKSKIKRTATSHLNSTDASSKRIKLETQDTDTAQKQPMQTQQQNNLMASNFSLYTAAIALHLQQQQQQQQQNNGERLTSPNPSAKFPFNFFQSQLQNGFINQSLIKKEKSVHQLICLNEQDIKQNLKYQEDLRLKLFGLSMSSAAGNANGMSNEQIRVLFEQIQAQLSESMKRHNELLNEKSRLKLMANESHSSLVSNDDNMSQFSSPSSAASTKNENSNQKNDEYEEDDDAGADDDDGEDKRSDLEDMNENIDVLK